MKHKIVFLTAIVFLSILLPSVLAQGSICVYEFYGTGCPHCAKVENFLQSLEAKYPNLEVHRFEVYSNRSNFELLEQFFDKYDITQKGVPVVFIADTYYMGDAPIINNLEQTLKLPGATICPSLDGGQKEELTLVKILSLAAIDAINPCAIAVLTLMLIAILTYNPKNKKKILYAGLAFIASVYILYMFYGLVIIQFFQIVQALTSIRLLLYAILGVIAIILGIVNIKDYFWYKPGGIMTEMPMRLRPKVKKIISGITSPKGAFVVGAFVTVFLLPCTIGPYVIAGGILSALQFLQTIPWLLFYNAIFILPMVIITLIIYKGIAHVEDVSGWKDKNIRYLHLIAGIIMALLGIAMVFGWI